MGELLFEAPPVVGNGPSSGLARAGGHFLLWTLAGVVCYAAALGIS